jgi:ATP-dependent exoDNAse (exonuclease V) beta subunit
MVRPAPSDAPFRARIQNDLNATLFVDAGAGTGKTTALVGRIVALIARGEVMAPQLAAITFTEKAAAELRDRLRRELERAAGPVAGGDPMASERCRQALEELDRAAICTLHAFAQRILAAHPLEAGLPPGFSVLDDVESSLSFQDRWDGWLDGYLSDPGNAELVKTTAALGLEPKHLQELAQRLHENWDRLDSMDPPFSPLPPMPAGDGIVKALRDAVGRRDGCRDPEDRMCRHLGRLQRYLRRLETAPEGPDRLRVLAEPLKLSFTQGQKGNWPPEVLDRLRDELKTVEATRAALLDGLRSRLAPRILSEVAAFVFEWAGARRTEGTLQFHDLLVLARNLLRDRPEARAAARRQWTHLLIDEFQDTDPLQAEIALLLTGVNVAEAGWQAAAVEPGRLFFVGDPKQSIYRFRRADIGLYRSVQARFPEGETQLTRNFRSQSSIIDWVNAVFAGLWAEDGDLQAPYIPLEPEHMLDAVRVRVLGGPRDVESLEDLREQEAEALVNGIAAVKAGAWAVTVRGDPGRARRDAEYGDVAVLLPTRTTLQPLTDALERRGIPYRVESRSLVFSSREVHDLLGVLAAIDDPTDQVALLAALRSPAFACSDSALLGFVQGGGRWNYLGSVPEALPEAAAPVVAAFAVLKDLHSQRGWTPPAALVERVVRELGFFPLAFAHHRPRDAWNRLRFMVDQARAYQEGGGNTLRGFVDWVERQAEEDRGIVEMVAPEQDDDAVRIMTVHASKGLDFPVVFLAGLNVRRAERTGAPALWRSDGGVEVRVGAGARTFKTSRYDPLDQEEKQHDGAEQHRLLYVAATRARDHLVVSLWHRNEDQRSHASVLWESCAAIPHLWQGWEPEEPAPTRAPAAPFDDTLEARARWLADRQRLLERAARRPVVAATAIARAADMAESKPEAVEELPPWRRGRAGTSIGRAVHSVLQTVDLDTGQGIVAIAAAQAAAEGVPGRAAEVERLVRAALASPVVREAVAGERYWREVFVSAAVGGTVVEGFIDLLYETPDGYVVVDYKTDNLPADADLDRALERYRLQGATYALALQQTLGRPVADVVFVFVRTPEAVARSVRDLPGALAEVAEVAGALG